MPKASNSLPNWFLSRERFDKFQEELHDAIREADALMNQSKPTTLAISSPSSTKLKGFVSICNSAIVKGELTIKSPNYNRGHPLKLSVDPAYPIALPQLKMARNCLQKSLATIKAFSDSDVSVVRKALCKLLQLIQLAKSCLTTQDPKKMFPHVFHSTFAEAPLDCAVDFGISDSMLLITATCLSVADSNPLEHALSQLKQVHSVKVNGKTVHIMDTIVVETQHPILSDVKIALGKIEALCFDFERKCCAIGFS
ncbi:hypothetical protein HDV03_002195 [Kappamyces sp. JEL0829]|nr:hypothetical protein HDV03_002195 [Kappamyces sp. JEL0829]